MKARLIVCEEIKEWLQLPVSLDCVFDASLVPETCTEPSPLPVYGRGIQFGKLAGVAPTPLNPPVNQGWDQNSS